MPSVMSMFDRTDGRAAASSESARRRLELLGASLAGELTHAGSQAPAGRADREGSASDPTDDPRASRTGSAVTAAAGTDADAVEPLTPHGNGRGRHAARSLPRRQRITAGLGDRIPVPVRAAWSTRLTGHHAAVVVLLIATALCVAAWFALSARAEVQSMPEMTPVTSVPSPAADPSAAGTGAASEPGGPWGSPAVTPGESGQPAPSTVGSSGPGAPAPSGTGSQAAHAADVVVVDVAGRVQRPGIVTLPVGARVADALDAAGGTRGRVDLTTLNLARVLFDGEQLLVGVEPAVPPAAPPPGPAGDAPAGDVPSPTSGSPSSAPGSLVNLNTATEAELDTLPGVGPVTAQAILAWRTDHGGFTSVDELLEVSGIGEVTLEELRPLVTV